MTGASDMPASGAGRHVVVVGGGISGLATALTLADMLGAAVTIEVREADDRLGGKLRASPFAGLAAVDEGADAFLARVPDATALATRVGLAGDLTSPTGATAAVWSGGLHPIPDGLLLGVPGDVVRLAGSGLLSWKGKLRAAIEPLLPRRADSTDSIGALIRSRFGDEVHERLVDALVGSIYGADTDRFSLAMVPQLAALAGADRSLLIGARRLRAGAPTAAGPLFLAPIGGMAALAATTADAASAAGVTIRTSAPVTELARDGTRWRVDGTTADAVVLATPAKATAPLLTSAAPDLARLLAMMDHASVAIVTAAIEQWPSRLRGRSGYLVPKPVQRTVTAASFGSQKWQHWRHGEREILRISLGRDGLPVDELDDGELAARAVDEAGTHTDVDLQPAETRVSRWPAAFPQYRPHHRDWLAAVEAAQPDGLFVTGASYDGIGVPACVAQANRVAADVVALLRDRR